jgi:NodT family efflux transporter outer membrane factor (OMF) lipoprotein
MALGVNYEVDLSGRNRRRLESARANEEQVRADLENTRLILCAQLVGNYFALRQLDADILLLRRLQTSQTRTLALTQVRYDNAFASVLDVAAARTILNSTSSQLLSLQDQRAHFEHAIATLVGVDAPRFSLPANPEPIKLTAIPAVSLLQPSELLQRRPDVASAERAMAAANAQIGIAKSAYFPSFNFGLIAGGDAREAPWLFATGASSLWSVGLSGAQTLFDAGKTSAGVAAARASYEQSVATYRQTVLSAFEEVQNSLSSLGTLQQNQILLDQSRDDARQTYELLQFKYAQGAASQFDVVLAEQNWIGFERLQLQNHTQQLLNAVQLMKAMGGGWQVKDAQAD